MTNKSKMFKNIFYKYFNSLTVFAKKFVDNEEQARDLVQEVFIKIWESNTDFNSEIALKTYLYFSTKNICIDYYRKNKEISLVEEKEDILCEDNYLNEIIKEETYRILDEALDTLGDQSKKIIKMTMQGYSNKEVASSIGISLNTVKTLKLRAYKKLKTILGNELIVMLIACI